MEKSKNQIQKDSRRKERSDAIERIQRGDASGWHGDDLTGYIDDQTLRTPRLRVLLAQCNNITEVQLQLLLKDCQKSQHHIARKIIMEKLEMLPQDKIEE